MQIVIIRSHKGISEIPRVFCKNVIAHFKTKGFQVLNNKYCRRSCIALAERMDLPNVRSKFCDMFYRSLNRKRRILKLFFGLEIIIKSGIDTFKRSISHSVTGKHPFGFGDVIISDFSGMVKNTCKQSPVDFFKFSRRKLKRFLSEQFCNPRSNDICFLGICLNLLAVVTLAIIAFNALLRLGNIDFSLNMFFRSIKQIFRGFQSVNVLQADGSSPRIAAFCLCRFPLPDIRFKLILPILFSHLTTSLNQ